MRIRSIKPEFYRSEDVARLSREHRLLFISLWSYVDDNGVGVDSERAIAADCFGLDDDPEETRAFVREGLATLSRGLLLVRYEVAGKRYIHVTGWDKHQRVDRPNRARYPRPPADMPPVDNQETAGQSGEGESDRDTLATPSRESRAWNRGTEEQRNRGTEEKDSPRKRVERGVRDAQFEEFWEAYPRRVEKKGARIKWDTAIETTDPDVILAGARRYAATRHGQDPRYTKHPKTWLGNGCWDDEPPKPALRVVGDYQPYRDPIDPDYDAPF